MEFERRLTRNIIEKYGSEPTAEEKLELAKELNNIPILQMSSSNSSSFRISQQAKPKISDRSIRTADMPMYYLNKLVEQGNGTFRVPKVKNPE